MLEELDLVVAALENQRPAGVVIRSAKPSGFIAGADVNEFRGATDPRMVETSIGRAHAVIDRLEALRIPTVAVIHGFCLVVVLRLRWPASRASRSMARGLVFPR